MIKILGDINLSDWYFDSGSGIGSSIKRGANPFCNLSIGTDDFWIGNFECVCADIEDKTHPFVISHDDLSKFNHLNLYGIANNHVMQVGAEAYEQTINFCHNNHIQYVGSNLKRSTVFTHQGKKVGILAFSQRPDNFSTLPLYWHVPEYGDIQIEIDSLRDCDYKIAFLHWGYEFMNYPNIDQKLLGHWLIDNGIDLVVGMHPHVAQGVEIYKGKQIYYSLGNSVFHMNWEPTRYGLLLSVDPSSGAVTSEYTKIDKKGFPHIVKEVPQEYTLKYLNSLIHISEENEKYFSKAAKMTSLYRKANHKAILKDLLKGNSPYAKSMIKDFIKRRFLKR